MHRKHFRVSVAQSSTATTKINTQAHPTGRSETVVGSCRVYRDGADSMTMHAVKRCGRG